MIKIIIYSSKNHVSHIWHAIYKMASIMLKQAVCFGIKK